MSKNNELGWNLFAVELERVLAAHKVTLDGLDYRGLDDARRDKRVNSAAIHRLKESLKFQGTFPVLSSRDLENVTGMLKCTVKEKKHLFAAIMATGVQAKLTPRIKAKAARDAAYAILAIIEKAFDDDDGPLGNIILKGTNPMTLGDQDAYSQALAYIDKGILALHMLAPQMQQGFNDIEQPETTRETFYAFEQAIKLLDSIPVEQRSMYVDWKYWHTEATLGRDEASRYRNPR